MPMRAFDADDFRSVTHRGFGLLRGVVRGCDDELHGLFRTVCFQTRAEGQVGFVELLLLSDVLGGERLFVTFGDDGRLVALVRLPKNDLDLVVGEIFATKNFQVLVIEAGLPAFEVAFLNPLPVSIGHPIAFEAKCLWLFLELFARVNEHDAPAMTSRFFVP